LFYIHTPFGFREVDSIGFESTGENAIRLARFTEVSIPTEPT
jgi:hypothetical protein